jgi:5-methylcytosine-specific restriction endonuclease McrA
VDIISRKDAKAIGQKYYFTGKPCSRGHVDVRFVQGFHCKTCIRENVKRHYHSLDIDTRKRKREAQKQNVAQWRKAHADRQALYNVTRKSTDPDCYKRFYAAHRERRKQESQAWYRANSELALANRKVYAAANPDKVRTWGRKSALTRRAHKKRAFVEVVDPRVVFARDQGICGICLTPIDPASPWELDHKIPISRGGEHSYQNTQPSHQRCNRAKGAKLLSQLR